MNFVSLLGSTILLRPYVFVFLLLYLLSSCLSLGARRTVLFTVIAYGIAFVCEYTSTRMGFPFGDYYYIDATRDRELWISNVPFMDSLSFTFLSYASYSVALLLSFSNREIASGYYREGRRFRAVVFTGLFMMMIDLVIDPLALRGDRWFLGQIYGYPEPGLYFGVPMANFLGWAFVGALIVGVYNVIESRLPDRPKRRTDRAARLSVRLGGVSLYAVVLLFNLVMTWVIGESLLALIGVLLFVPVGSILLFRILDLTKETSS